MRDEMHWLIAIDRALQRPGCRDLHIRMIAVIIEMDAGGEGRNRVRIALHGKDGFIALRRINSCRGLEPEGFEHLPFLRVQGAQNRFAVIGDEQPPGFLFIRVKGLHGGERGAKGKRARFHEMIEWAHSYSPVCYNITSLG